MGRYYCKSNMSLDFGEDEGKIKCQTVTVLCGLVGFENILIVRGVVACGVVVCVGGYQCKSDMSLDSGEDEGKIKCQTVTLLCGLVVFGNVPIVCGEVVVVSTFVQLI